jgi:hypothetical protein
MLINLLLDSAAVGTFTAYGRGNRSAGLRLALEVAPLLADQIPVVQKGGGIYRVNGTACGWRDGLLFDHAGTLLAPCVEMVRLAAADGRLETVLAGFSGLTSADGECLSNLGWRNKSAGARMLARWLEFSGMIEAPPAATAVAAGSRKASRTVTIDDATAETLRAFGDGNLSAGIRRASASIRGV